MPQDFLTKQLKNNYKKLMGIEIKGVGYYLPEKVLTNFDLEKMMDTSDEWIRTRTGIEKRHIARDDEATSDMGVKAGKMALERSGLSPEDIDLVILATATPDYFISASASIIQDKLGLKNCPAFDIAAGCTGFVYGMVIASQYLKSGKYKNALVIGAETLSRILDWEDRNTAVLFGDGAGAAIISKSEDENKGFLNFCLTSKPEGGKFLTLPAGGSLNYTSEETVKNRLHYVHMNGREVFKFATTWATMVAELLVRETFPEGETIDYFIPHQANMRINQVIAKKLKLKAEQVLSNISETGNTSAASIPILLGQELEKGTIKTGDTILAVGFGAGLTAGGFIYQF